MRKVIGLIILSILLLTFVGCQNKTVDAKHKDINIESNNALNEDNKGVLTVDIIADTDIVPEPYKGLPIIFKPEIEGENDKEVQCHWILENHTDFEGFYIPEKGPQKEIINSGEPVELRLFADVSYIEGAYDEFKVKLQVEDKETSNVIDTDEIIIENKEGLYEIKQ